MNRSTDNSLVRPAVYVASPLGFTESGKRYLAEVLHSQLRAAKFTIHDPWDDPDGKWSAIANRALGPERDRDLAALNASTGARNAQLIETSDAVLAILDGSEIDSGTAAEIGYAAALQKPIVGLRTDTRIAADNDQAFVNLQVQHFIVASGGSLCRSVDRAIAALIDAVA